jgi:hypothetical protein
VSPHCTYANEVRIESSIRRYIDGRSSSEIALDLHNGITSDMRLGIISAARETFPKIPIRIFLMHFLRDLGKVILLDCTTISVL